MLTILLALTGLTGLSLGTDSSAIAAEKPTGAACDAALVESSRELYQIAQSSFREAGLHPLLFNEVKAGWLEVEHCGGHLTQAEYCAQKQALVLEDLKLVEQLVSEGVFPRFDKMAYLKKAAEVQKSCASLAAKK